MTEKQPPLPIRSPVAPPSDKTAVDGTRVSSKAQAEPNPPEFDPSKFGVIPIDPEVRKDILEKKLQRLGPEFFRDTLPPNQPLTAPAGAVGASPVAPSLVPTAVSPDLVTTQLTARSLAARRRRQSLMLVGPLVVGASLLLLFAVLKVAGRVGRPPGASCV